MKLDACMWAKNGAAYLSSVLQRFDSVIPQEVLGQRIFVDDHSEDDTAQMARDFNWAVYENPRGGIASGANEALRHVETNFFISLEQDVLLSPSWWPRIFDRLSSDPNVAVCQGVRFFRDATLRAVWEHETMEHLDELIEDNVYRSIDNNIYRTKLIRAIGGFPERCPKCVDWWLKKAVESHGYKWIVDPTVVSDHLRSSIWGQASHQPIYDKLCTCRPVNETTKYVLKLAAFSPISGVKLALRYRAPKAAVLYPYFRLKYLQGHVSAHR